MDNLTLPRMLDDNLLLRCSTKGDAERLGELYIEVFKLSDGSPEYSFIPWVRDLLDSGHPTFHEGDFTIIEDVSSGKFVSAMNLISQTWSYGGIRVPVGRPEAVATLPAYRNRGLVRAQFEVVHEWSRQRGELLQGITGIPFYYRLFGYEMCVDLEGGRMGYPDSLPALTERQQQAYQVRPASESDVEFLSALYQRGCERLLISCPRDKALWHYELLGRSAPYDDNRVVWMITSASGEALGFFLHPPALGPDYMNPTGISCYWYELKAGASYLEITPVVLHHLLKTGRGYAEKAGKACTGVGLWLDSEHPALQVSVQSLPNRKEAYAWYILVNDLPAFLTHVAPVLEQRLANSPCAGYSGDLNLSFYRSKLTFCFTGGRLQEVTQVHFSGEEGCQAAFPGQTFLHLVFGYRTLEEVEHMFPDCWAEDQVRPLLVALFPRLPSNIWPIS